MKFLLFIAGIVLLAFVFGRPLFARLWSQLKNSGKIQNLRERRQYERDIESRQRIDEEIDRLLAQQDAPKFSLPVMMGSGILGSLLMFNGAFWFNAELGHYYATQDVFGNQTAVLTPGPKVCLWCTIRDYDRVVPLKFDGKLTENQNAGGDGEGKEIISDAHFEVLDGAIQPVTVRFNDSVVGYASSSETFELPANQEDFLLMANAFTSSDILRDKVLIPAVQQAMRNSARTLSAQEYFSGKGGEFEFAVRDQLESGIYMLEQHTVHGDGDLEGGGVSDAFTQDETRTIERAETVRYEVRKRLDKEGNPVRGDNPLARYGIKVAQATITDVTPEEQFRRRQARQRDEAAKTNLARLAATRAQYEKELVIAEGEKSKAETRVGLEKKQLEETIAAETEKKKADIGLETARVSLATAQVNAQSTKATADADAYRQRELAEATGNLDQRLAAYTQVMSAFADAIKGQPVVPSIVMGGGQGSQSSTSVDQVMNLVGAKAAKDLLGTEQIVPKPGKTN